MTVTALQRAEWFEHEAGRLAGLFPYVYGGGHGVPPNVGWWGRTFEPTKGIDPEGTNPKGYDCSAWFSALAWYAGILSAGSITNASLAPGTEELAGWGQPGPGALITLFVRNSGGIHHCVTKITLPGQTARWTAAASTGTICGWQNYGTWDPTKEEYVARHYASL